MKTFIFAATKGKKEQTLLYNTLKHEASWIQEDNTKSLAKCYNKAIDFAIEEDIDKFLLPMSETNQESIGSMGDDTPPAVVSTKRRKFYDYFKQKFAQVTNPPIDSLREKSVMSLFKYLGTTPIL